MAEESFTAQTSNRSLDRVEFYNDPLSQGTSDYGRSEPGNRSEGRALMSSYEDARQVGDTGNGRMLKRLPGR